MNVPKLRFKEFTDEWTFTTLKDVATKVNRVESNNSPIMMISAEKGFILQSQKYSKDMTGDSLKKYITLYKNELAYNHGASKLRPYGSVFMLLEDKARIPFVYHCFKITNGYNKFFSYYLNRYSFGRLLKPLISSTARMDGLLNISFDNYFSIKFKIPQLKEQEKIANLLTTVDKKITNLENIITNLENQKKGLLQQIFSQKLRFKDKNGNNYPNWEKKKLGNLFTIKAGGDINKENFSEQYSMKFKYPVYANALTNDGLYGYSNIYKIDKPSITVTGRGINVGFALSRKPFYYPIVRLLVLIPNININFTFFTESINFIHIFNESTGVPQLTAPQLSKVNVYVPNIEEQNKIGNLFDKLNEKIDNKKAQLEHWKQIKKGLLQQMFV